MIFGGKSGEMRSQISIVESCQLKRVGSLMTEFTQGGCNTFETYYEEEIMLCFSKSNQQGCHR